MSMHTVEPTILAAPGTGAALVTFERGIPGFPELSELAITTVDDYGMFVWLSSVDVASVAFLAVNPFVYFPDYDVELTAVDSEVLDVHEEDELIVFCLVTIDREARLATANMVAPIVVNMTKGRAQQVILDGEYEMRTPLPVPPAGNGVTADVAVVSDAHKHSAP